MKSVRYLLMWLLMLLAGCSAGQFTAATPHRLKKALDKNYTVLVNGDTLVFDKLLLDDHELQNVMINKSIKTVSVTTDAHNRLVSIDELNSATNATVPMWRWQFFRVWFMISMKRHFFSKRLLPILLL